MSILRGLSHPAARIALPLALIAIFLGLGFYSHSSELGRPFYGHPDDDWTHYHKHAVDVLENGLSIPSLPKAYTTPAGFLYIYSVAFIYRLFGVNPGAVYLAQSALLGFSVWLLFLAFGRGLSPSGKTALLCMLVVYAFFDVQRPYTGRLLSENLAIWEVALFFNLLLWGYADNRSWARVASLAWLGVLYLTRPNFLPFAAACPIWLGIWHHGRGKAPYWEFALGLILMFFIVNLMGLRNYMAAGHWSVIPPLAWNQAVDVHLPTPWYWLSHPGEVAWSMVIRTLYAAGFMPLLVKEFSYRPHWWVLWLACLIVAVKRWRQTKPFSLEEKGLMLYIITVMGPIILVGYLTGYGFRFLVPVTLPAVGMAARLWDELRPQKAACLKNAEETFAVVREPPA